MDSKHKKNAKVFKAFCDEKRLAILELLQTGEKCACVLMDKLEITQSGLSYHMKILCESGVVDSRPDGKWVYYRISEQGSRYAAQLLIALTTPTTAVEQDCDCT